MLIQLLLPTSGGASADGVAPLAQTRRELADRFTSVTARRAWVGRTLIGDTLT